MTVQGSLAVSKSMREWVFKWRGALLIPAGLSVYVFGTPTRESFVVGLVIALLGEAVRVWGVGYTGVTTRDNKVIAPRLTTAGPYAYLRNPLYLGNCITALGFYVAACGAASMAVRIALAVLMVALYGGVYGTIIPLEEAYLGKTFGLEYTEYCKRVPRMLPNFAPYADPQGTFDWQVIPQAEVHTIGLLLIVGVLFFLKLLGWGI
ncbi:MAG: methyltransferase family protein [Candidatus Xenobia bacterium]